MTRLNRITSTDSEDNLIITTRNNSITTDTSGNELSDSSHRKKLKKASRACDQCRKRKIKCDVNSNNAICINCTKNSEKCTFQRVQLKRGPSKGYNKKLSSSKSTASATAPASSPSAPAQGKGNYTLLLPPIAQYLPTVNDQPSQNTNPNKTNNGGPSTSSGGTPNISGANKQPFWKVPYHVFNNLPDRRDSMDSSMYSSDTESNNLKRPRSSSIPPLLRNMSGSTSTSTTNSLLNSSNLIAQQPLYPYSQFSQQQQQQQQQLPINTPGLSIITSQNKHHSRNSSFSLISDTTSPMTNKPISIDQPKKRKRSNSMKSTTSKRKNSNNSSIASPKTAATLLNQNISITTNSPIINAIHIDAIHIDEMTENKNLTINYGKISDIDLVNTYYEFIHVNFPILPLNKKTLTNDILMVNTQLITNIHELNNYIIKWFRNSLEVLVRISLKKNSKLNNDNDNNNTNHDENDNNYNQTILINSLNQCFQKVIDIYPKIKENEKNIDSKIKIVYLSNFLILNYILSFLGHDNSFVLGLSVTIFNEWNLQKKLLQSSIGNLVEKNDNENNYQIIFIRLYILLIFFDSMQSISFGTPKLINFPTNNFVARYFNIKASKNFNEKYIEKWCIDENSSRLSCILKNLELAECITFLTNKRILYINDSILKSYINENAIENEFKSESNKIIYISEWFTKLLIEKRKLINLLFLSIDTKLDTTESITNDMCENLTDCLCSLISTILQVLTLIMRLNPTNSIDYDYRPLQQLTGDDKEKTTNDNSTNNNNNNTNNNNTNGNKDFYKNLLGLNNDNNLGLSDLTRGCISPFSISIIHEVYNVTQLIKRLPTSLIGVVMETTVHNDASPNPNFKPQQLVLNLSNSMNEVVQITSLLSMIKPYKGFEYKLQKLQKRLSDSSSNKENTSGSIAQSDLDSTRNNATDIATSTNGSIFRKLYYDNNNNDQKITKESVNETNNSQPLGKFVTTAWNLLDDSELGWF